MCRFEFLFTDFPFSFFLSRPTGDITQKGYEKKRSRLLAPYLPKPPTSTTTTAGKRPEKKRENLN
jgi:hypothetical protein